MYIVYIHAKFLTYTYLLNLNYFPIFEMNGDNIKSLTNIKHNNISSLFKEPKLVVYIQYSIQVHTCMSRRLIIVKVSISFSKLAI